ncbi:MAG: hypothetical protein WD875_08810 [Pirellulales bacterium]
MKTTSRSCSLAVMVALAGMLAQHVSAQDAGESHFQRGYYLQTLKNDPAGAAKAFEQVLGEAGVSAEMKADAQTRLVQCREDLAATDMAQLMPSEALAYIEVNRPGEHVGNLIRMFGLLGDSSAGDSSTGEKGAAKNATGDKPDAAAIPLDGPFVMPTDFAVSPALVRELEKVRGFAIAVTAVDHRGIPDGVAVIHPGESDLLRGLAETSIQFVQRADSIEGYKTYQIENEVWLVQTARLFVVARSKDQAAAAIARLKNPAAASLASNKRFAKLADDRKNALAFCYVAGDQIAPLMIARGAFTEAMIARSVLDLDHLESLVAVAGTTQDGVAVKAKAVMAEGHRNLAYALIRTAPASRRTLASVPSGAAVVGILGLNPASEAAAEKTPAARAAEGEPRYVTAMDLGREVFANIEEVSVFVMPSANADARVPIPEVGLVFGVKDAGQSQALWDQLLALPSMFGAPLTSAPADVTIEGAAGRQFRFPFIPPIVLVAQKDRTFLAGTQGAVAASLRVAAGKQDSLAKDPQLQSLVDSLPAHTSKGAVVHVGRAMRLIAPVAGRGMPPEMAAASSAFDNLTLSLVTDEQPTEFAIRAEVKGMPNVTQIAKMAFEMERVQRQRYLEARRQIEAVRAEQDRAIEAAQESIERAELSPPRVERRIIDERTIERPTIRSFEEPQSEKPTIEEPRIESPKIEEPSVESPRIESP